MRANILRLGSVDRLDELYESSRSGPVVLFKHSERCGISAHLLEEMSLVEGEVHVVVVQAARDVSDAIAERTGYRHHSPQAFVILGGEVVYHASHYAIDSRAINEKLAAARPPAAV